MKIDFFRLFLLGTFSGARAYLDEMAKAVPHLREQAVQVLEREAKEKHMEYDDYDCSRQEIESVFDHTMPEILARSFIVYLHSIVEQQLAEVAGDVRERRNIQLKHNEIAGSPVERSRLYLSKVAGIPVADLPGWGVLRDIAKIRDVVVHRAGAIGNDATEIRRLRELSLRTNGLVDTSLGWDRSDSEIRFDVLYCTYAVEEARRFFETLLDQTRGPEEEVNIPVTRKGPKSEPHGGSA